MRVIEPICTKWIVPRVGIIDAVAKLSITLVKQIVVVAIGGITLVMTIAAPIDWNQQNYSSIIAMMTHNYVDPLGSWRKPSAIETW